MKVEFLNKKNQLVITKFPMTLFSKTSLYKVLNLLKDDFFISFSVHSLAKKNTDGENTDKELDFLDISLISKKKMRLDDAREFFREMMNSLISFEKGKSLLETEKFV
jgi:hypothetical protein